MNKKISLDSYEIMAEDYASFVDEKPWNADYERPCTMKLLGEVKEKTILDAGCAGGWYTKQLLDLGAKKVVALDFSPSMIKATENRIKTSNIEESRYEIRQHDLNNKLEFLGDNSFDTILTSLTLHYLKNWTQIFEEFNRVLKVGGELIISVHHPTADWIRFKRENYFEKELATDVWNMNGKKVEVQFYVRSLSEMTNTIADNGFIMERVEESMPTQDFKRKNPKSYEWLLKNPNFIFFKCRKK